MSGTDKKIQVKRKQVVFRGGACNSGEEVIETLIEIDEADMLPTDELVGIIEGENE